MNALIIGAGLGSRMRTDSPKPLIRIHGVPIIQRTIISLRDAGFTEIIIVIGFKGDLIDTCLLGLNADCNLCGCISPLYLRMISKWWKYLNKRTIDILTLPRDIKQCRKPGEK